MKLLGALLLMASGLACGLGRAWELKSRVSALAELKRFIQQTRTEVLYAARPLGQVLALDESRFGQEARRQAVFDRDPLEAIKQAGQDILASEKDRNLFNQFAEGLGASGVQGQQEHFQLYGALLEEQLAQAQGEYREKYRLYTALGLFAGVAVCIVVI